jgi:hypothetical protein
MKSTEICPKSRNETGHLFHFSLRSRCTAMLAGLRTLIHPEHGPDQWRYFRLELFKEIPPFLSNSQFFLQRTNSWNQHSLGGDGHLQNHFLVFLLYIHLKRGSQPNQRILVICNDAGATA